MTSQDRTPTESNPYAQEVDGHRIARMVSWYLKDFPHLSVQIVHNSWEGKYSLQEKGCYKICDVELRFEDLAVVTPKGGDTGLWHDVLIKFHPNIILQLHCTQHSVEYKLIDLSGTISADKLDQMLIYMIEPDAKDGLFHAVALYL
jgi:hypothetical protein